ncbi:YraN family protein [Desulfovibrio sp. OttesenSCG-928-A18]|nr:YraN family protein [Desulfovibrio sp. OttesenSCG-928-A18]
MLHGKTHMALGADGEEAAARYLAELGWRLCERNWRPGGAGHGLELDIIARCKDCLIFVEVKTRTSGPGAQKDAGGGIPVYASFTARKRARLLRAAGLYLSLHDCWHQPCRFDLICVRKEPEGRLILEHHCNVIELRDLMDSGDSAWQPW